MHRARIGRILLNHNYFVINPISKVYHSRQIPKCQR